MTLQYCFDGSAEKVNNPSVSSPRTWGCFPATRIIAKKRTVFPTHVGVFLRGKKRVQAFQSLPHARGGVSPATLALSCGRVFPTHVGVFLVKILYRSSLSGLPHARGGVSIWSSSALHGPESSPRTWGCFSKTVSLYDHALVFPTHVGVFPELYVILFVRDSLPHARGGVSKMVDGGIVRKTSSPRMWGCFSGRTWNGFRVEGGKAGESVKFELIRRITGYLVGTVERFSNAKQAEIMDRVKHTV